MRSSIIAIPSCDKDVITSCLLRKPSLSSSFPPHDLFPSFCSPEALALVFLLALWGAQLILHMSSIPFLIFIIHIQLLKTTLHVWVHTWFTSALYSGLKYCMHSFFLCFLFHRLRAVNLLTLHGNMVWHLYQMEGPHVILKQMLLPK